MQCYLNLIVLQTILIQVELPNDERTVVRVSPALSLRELMSYICEKRNMDESKYWFDLPATEESLAGKTLEQLKIINFKVICRCECVGVTV